MGRSPMSLSCYALRITVDAFHRGGAPRLYVLFVLANFWPYAFFSIPWSMSLFAHGPALIYLWRHRPDLERHSLQEGGAEWRFFDRYASFALCTTGVVNLLCLLMSAGMIGPGVESAPVAFSLWGLALFMLHTLTIGLGLGLRQQQPRGFIGVGLVICTLGVLNGALGIMMVVTGAGVLTSWDFRLHQGLRVLPISNAFLALWGPWLLCVLSYGPALFVFWRRRSAAK
jgi:hypothetical protein